MLRATLEGKQIFVASRQGCLCAMSTESFKKAAHVSLAWVLGQAVNSEP
jgi:hypothetical protein